MDGSQQHRRLEFSPILIGLIGVAAGAIIVATYHCLVNNCCCTQSRIQNAVAQQSERQGLGVEITNHNRRSMRASNSAAQLMPMFRYGRECKEGMCAVCLCEFKDGETIRVLTECMHLFHVGCIDVWLRLHSNCPLCRTDVMPPPQQHVVLSMPTFTSLAV